MKKTLLALAIIAGAATAQAKSYTYQCDQVRTTAQEAVAKSALKSTVMVTDGQQLLLQSSSIKIASADPRLLTGGAPLMHITYGGYFTSTANEVFQCEREI